MDLFGVMDKNTKGNTKENPSDEVIADQMSWESGNISDIGCDTILSAVDKIVYMTDAFDELKVFNNNLDKQISSIAAYYWFFKETYNISRVPRNKLLSDGIKKYEFLKDKKIKLSYSFIPDDFDELQQMEFEFCIHGNVSFNMDKVSYFLCLSNVKRDILECFMTEDVNIIKYHINEANETISRLEESTNFEIERSKQLLSQFFSNSEDGFITELIRSYIETRQSNMDAVAILDSINYISDRFKDSISYFEEKYNESLNIDIGKLNTLLGSLRPSTSARGIVETESYEFIPAELEDSLDRILELSALPDDKIDFFKKHLVLFKTMDNKDKFDLLLPETRNRFISIFFEIYDAVLIRVIKENINDKAVDMFLVFGFIDNSLLTNQQTIALSKMLDLYTNDGNVYSMKRWLTKVYNREKSPSINDMGEDYEQVIGDKKAKGHFAGKGSNDSGDSGDKRLNYEIMNMLKTNHRLCYGHISSYFPILHSDMLPKDISRAAVTVGKINESLLNILNADYSAFHREVFYTGDNPNFKKELIMKQVIPDIILVPIFGSKAIMWQEISGRSKVSPGRLMIPIFTLDDLNGLVTKLVGNFRWELCRTVMGFHWNDITYKSLTSEYADYIQCYKRNNNLSQEYKESIRLQIQRYRNNLRDIFTSDYESWVKYEAAGIRKVNKEVRTILYNYCPFRQNVREELIKQPAFSNIAAPFEFKRKKYIKELESKYAYFAKNGKVLDSELEDNLKFFKEF